MRWPGTHPLFLLHVCRATFLHVADAQIGLFEGKRVDLYYLIMMGEGAIRVMGVLTPPLRGHCTEEGCEKEDDSREQEKDTNSN